MQKYQVILIFGQGTRLLYLQNKQQYSLLWQRTYSTPEMVLRFVECKKGEDDSITNLHFAEVL